MDKAEDVEEVEVVERIVDASGKGKRSEMGHEVGEDGHWIRGPGLSGNQRVGVESEPFDLIYGGMWLD